MIMTGSVIVRYIQVTKKQSLLLNYNFGKHCS